MTFGTFAVGTVMVNREGVVEICRQPGGGAVAIGTLSGEMIGRPVAGMTTLAVGCPGSRVVEAGRAPGVGVVAG